MTAAEDLAQALVAVDVADEAFVVDNLDKAAWAVAKIRRHRARLTEAEGTWTEWRKRIDDWIDGERHRAEQATSHLEHLLRRYHEQRITEDNPDAATWADVKRSKTIRTPAGDLVARKAPDRVEVDEAVFVAWATDHAADMLTPPKPRTPDKRAIKAAVGEVMADGQVVDGVTGVFLPGVTWVDGDVTYTVTTPDEGVGE